MLVVIGSTDLTNNIQADSYAVEAEDAFEQWLDGNRKKHRVYTSTKVNGSFNVICGAPNGISKADFLELLEDNTVNHVLTLTCLVKNTGEMEAVECFYKLTTTMLKGDVAVYKLTLEEC